VAGSEQKPALSSAVLPVTTPFQPTLVGRYLLLHRIGTGGMAEVYLAKASGPAGFEKRLAIKRILPSFVEEEEIRALFEHEAKLSSVLDHANIVHTYDFLKLGFNYFLILEYIDGKNLAEILFELRKQAHLLPTECALYLTAEVCKGLDYAHNRKDDTTV